ncbi:MAG: tRNA (adenosine(37)-N6)-dimethylallyltransferase MiaA [Firmicutes bacterium]|nr:tRNA (adenosine(37)-N6)-dimethylallyltransferase MiaA [Bacillota bacterium]
MEKCVLAIMGPTASGKSSLAVEIAKSVNGEIISADSAQIYKDLKIITARTTEDEMGGIPHHLSGFLELDHDFSVAEFMDEARRCMADIVGRGKVPVVAGGTGLYIKSLLEDYQIPSVPADNEFREQMKQRALNEGGGVLYGELTDADPDAAARIHPNNVQRVIRALEVIKYTGKPFSFFCRRGMEGPLGLKVHSFGITYPKEILHDRINRRVDLMMDSGAIGEIEAVIAMGKKNRLETLKILGTREIISILEGKCTKKEGIELIKRNTRRYAKRQLTWFKSHKDLQWIDMEGGETEKQADTIRRMLGMYK